MVTKFRPSTAPLIATIQKVFSKDLAKENDFLRQENRILRSKLGNRVRLTESDRRILVRFGLSLKERLADVITIVRLETLIGALADHSRAGCPSRCYPPGARG